MLKQANTAPRTSEAGFTLVEALVAMVVLAVGITAVANLMLVGASSNSVGNAATASAALASRELERLKAVDVHWPWSPAATSRPTPRASSASTTCPGSACIRTRWTVAATRPPTVRLITVRSEGEGAMTAGPLAGPVHGFPELHFHRPSGAAP